MVCDFIAARYLLQEDSDDIEKIKNKYDLNINKLRAIRREVVRNTAHSLIKAVKDSNLEDLNTMFFDFNNIVPLNVKIIDEDLYYDAIDHYLNIIKNPLSIIQTQYEDITKIKSYITKNKITIETFIKSYKDYVSYSEYFTESFDLITDDEIRKFILMNLSSTNEMAKQSELTQMKFNEEDIPFDIPDIFERRIENSILESFNIIKIMNYWNFPMITSEFVSQESFALDIKKSTDKAESTFDFNKLKPGFEIQENSPAAIWYLAILHAYCDGVFDKTDNLLLVNTLKICLGVTAAINKIVESGQSDDYFEQVNHDNDLLMNFLKNKLFKIKKITDVEFWDAYIEASDKITDPDLQDFAIAICVWVAQVETADIQNKAIGKLRLLWGRFSQEATSSWLNEINAYASGDKG